jgi:integrase
LSYDSSSYQQQEGQEQQQPRIYDVTEGLKSKHTKVAYRIAFNHFLKVTIKNDGNLRALLDTKQNVIESKIIDHITYLKDVEKLTYRSILVHLSGIFHFFEINGVALNTRKIKRFMPEDESEYYAKDRPYSIKEIEQILEKCDIRARVVVLIMVSSGMRIGGLRELQIGDIKKIDEFSLYMIWVYNRSGKDRYYTFTTPECAAAIDAYLDYRRRLGDELKDSAPLIRDKFNVDDPFTAMAPKFLSIRMLSFIFEDVLKRAGVNQAAVTKPKWKKRDVMRSHGFRKFFITQCDKAHMNFTLREYLSGHRLPNQDASYNLPTEEDRLTEYVKAIPLLTIDPTQRLKQENAELRKDYLAELGDLREEFNEMKQLLVHLSKESQKQLVNEFHQKVGDKADIEWSCD